MEKMKMVVLLVVGISGIYCGDAGASLSQNFNLQGVHVNASTGGYDETAYANVWGRLEQGVNGRYYQPEYSNVSFNTYEWDPSAFSICASWNFAIVGEEDYVPNFNISEGQGNYFDVFGINLSWNSTIKNYTEWIWDEEQWNQTITDDIEFLFSFNLEPARMEGIGLQVHEWEEDPIRNTLWVSFSGGGQFIAGTEAEADAIGSMFMIPEPTTVAFLGLGSLFLLKRKK